MNRLVLTLTNIDWHLVADIAVPITAVFLTVWAQRRFERRPVLITWLGHVSAFQVQRAEGSPPVHVFTHAVALRNTGRRSATNVRIRHNVLPDFVICPDVQHHVEEIHGDGREIVIPTLVPGEEIIISYLYFPPLTFPQINAGITSNEGFARTIPVLLQRQYPRWVQRTVTALVLIGIVSVVYLIVRGFVYIF